ncbi:uncharacterized protein LACBIDRAFT_309937 [Laccaria bicolor S238N-H82]|uniref:Predicted protein n=1 Tax=Laccaria bicolor (strain S238N-H82 / ATCC MYA-4686) TaxID=486041 RepID=B0DWC0_LACBS|nr:uncharacterized protein LACBIDRAFT_312519 [Laccaria bicolor S238N-H82]XP_001891202.1 uncharacterized protein LACBIDRAFT_309937 [Laccaria bicolor S238N-H82]EDQ98147.1 predicted protein [Laccaria bicolor S238N-H82]EDR01161.1 predicted protein [Laccaria bicolor S238N-H82]|eukprot:XP_001888203.1 predicted protein [Laccaria bicolor S238N-H82]
MNPTPLESMSRHELLAMCSPEGAQSSPKVVKAKACQNSCSRSARRSTSGPITY